LIGLARAINSYRCEQTYLCYSLDILGRNYALLNLVHALNNYYILRIVVSKIYALCAQ